MIEPEAYVYLARHAESVLNVNGHIIGGRSNETPLTPRGVEQAVGLGQFIRRTNLNPDYAFSSPAVRALETTRIAFEHAGYDHSVTIEDGVQELDQGQWTGLQRDKIYTPQVLKIIENSDKSFKAPGGESMDDVGIRMLDTLDERVDKLLEETPTTLWFSTHGFAIKCFASCIHNWSRHRTYTSEVPNASVTLFTRTNRKWKLEYLGRQTS
jgi:broad specificity phosphatase PhoE